MEGRVHCPRCDYDMRGVPPGGRSEDSGGTATCPECGWTGPVQHLQRWEPPPSRGWGYAIVWWLTAVTVVGLVVLAVAAAIYAIRVI